MNKHIELVKKWLDDPSSVTVEELKANATEVAYLGYVADAATWAVAVAAHPSRTGSDITAEYVKKYEELTEQKDNE